MAEATGKVNNMTTTKRTIRLTDRQVAALESLFAAVGIVGQRGTNLNAGFRHLAETADAAMSETVAAYEIASGCAAGEDWSELVQVIEPKFEGE